MKDIATEISDAHFNALTDFIRSNAEYESYCIMDGDWASYTVEAAKKPGSCVSAKELAEARAFLKCTNAEKKAVAEKYSTEYAVSCAEMTAAEYERIFGPVRLGESTRCSAEFEKRFDALRRSAAV